MVVKKMYISGMSISLWVDSSLSDGVPVTSTNVSDSADCVDASDWESKWVVYIESVVLLDGPLLNKMKEKGYNILIHSELGRVEEG